jgi:hypothetical protein
MTLEFDFKTLGEKLCLKSYVVGPYPYWIRIQMIFVYFGSGLS